MEQSSMILNLSLTYQHLLNKYLLPTKSKEFFWTLRISVETSLVSSCCFVHTVKKKKNIYIYNNNHDLYFLEFKVRARSQLNPPPWDVEKKTGRYGLALCHSAIQNHTLCWAASKDPLICSGSKTELWSRVRSLGSNVKDSHSWIYVCKSCKFFWISIPYGDIKQIP